MATTAPHNPPARALKPWRSSSSTRARTSVTSAQDHVDDLAASIKLRGIIVPLTVRPVGDRLQLVAGWLMSSRMGAGVWRDPMPA